jgi:hypothetical protein
MLAASQRWLRSASWTARSATRRSRAWPAPPTGAAAGALAGQVDGYGPQHLIGEVDRPVLDIDPGAQDVREPEIAPAAHALQVGERQRGGGGS